MKITYKQLREIVTEAIKECNVSGNVGGYMVPKAFKKKNTVKITK